MNLWVAMCVVVDTLETMTVIFTEEVLDCYTSLRTVLQRAAFLLRKTQFWISCLYSLLAVT